MSAVTSPQRKSIGPIGRAARLACSSCTLATTDAALPRVDASGLKLDPSGRMVDFTNIYETLLVPAVRDAGFQIARAREPESGEGASRQIFDRLLQSEHMIVDVSDRSSDISYELGIRHALRPHGTTVICADSAARPFYDGVIPVIAYRIDRSGRLSALDRDMQSFREQLSRARSIAEDDSPLFRLVDYAPRLEIDPGRAAILRARTAATAAIVDRLRSARRQGRAAVLQVAADPVFANLGDLDTSAVLELVLSLRDAGAYTEMVALYRRMPVALQQAR